MTDYQILKGWLDKSKANYEESQTSYDDCPMIIIWTSSENDSNVTFFFNKDGSYNDFEVINEYEDKEREV